MNATQATIRTLADELGVQPQRVRAIAHLLPATREDEALDAATEARVREEWASILAVADFITALYVDPKSDPARSVRAITEGWQW